MVNSSGNQNDTNWENQNSGQTGGSTEQSTSGQSGTSSQTGTQAQYGTTGQSGTQAQFGNTANLANTGVDAASQQYINQMRQLALSQVGGLLAAPAGGGARDKDGFPIGWDADPEVQAWAKTADWDGDPGHLPDRIQNRLKSQGVVQPRLNLTPEVIQSFANPHVDEMVNATRGEFDHLRAGAGNATNQAATMAGAFGGSRHGVAQGVRMGELDRAQGSTIAGIKQNAYLDAANRAMEAFNINTGLDREARMEPLMRAQAAMGLMNLGMGPTGMTSSSSGSTGMTGTNALSGFNNMTGTNSLFGSNNSTGFNNSSGTNYLNGYNNSSGGGTSRYSGRQDKPKGGSALGGAAGGAMTGASIGSVIPGIGTGIGAAIGGGLGLLGWL